MLESGRPKLRTPTPSSTSHRPIPPSHATVTGAVLFTPVPGPPESTSSANATSHGGRAASTVVGTAPSLGHGRSNSHNHSGLPLSVNAHPNLHHAPPIKSKPPLLRSLSDTSHVAAAVSQLPSEQIVTYRSYARHTNNPDYPYMSFVRGWLFHPHLNRKGKLMIAALEKVVGSPGKYSSIAEAAAQVSESEINKHHDELCEPKGAGASTPVTPSRAPHDSFYDSPSSTPAATPTTTPGGTPNGTPPSGTPSGTPNGTRSGTPSGMRNGTPSSTPEGILVDDGSHDIRQRWLSRENSSDSVGRGSLHRLSSAASNGLQTLTSHTVGALHHRLNSPSTTSFTLGTPRSQSPAPSPGNTSPNISRTSSWINFRPSMLRTRSAKSSVDLHQSPSHSACNPAPGTQPPSPQFNGQSGEDIANQHNETVSTISLSGAPKRPQPRRTGTFTNEGKSKHPSASHLAKKGHKLTMRERMAAIAHKSLPYRDVKIVIESEPDSHGHTLRRTFWATTDESGRFSNDCGTPFRPAKVRAFHGAASHESSLLLMPRTGLSVISDIDDTVRHTGVTKSKREVLHNVLARSFDDCSLDGVADWYKRMASAGANFHYVSNSPWQLYDVVTGFLGHHSFPEGSMHLKKYAGVFDGLEAVKERKKGSLEKIVRDFPGHKFILVGDSGEADLEAYSALAKEFPDQVVAIFIRDISLTHEESLQVYQRHFEKYRPSNWCPLDTQAPPKLPLRVRSTPANNEPSTQPDSTGSPKQSSDDLVDISRSATDEHTPKSSLESHSSAGCSSSSSQSEYSTENHTSGEPQSPAPKSSRPRLLRRTSSKIIDHISSATRFLGPQQHPPRPPTGPNVDRPTRPAPATHLRHAKTFDASRAGTSSNNTESGFRIPHLASRARTVLGGGGDPHAYENDIDHVFVPSTQDIVDYERNSDKRSDSWKQRVFAQHAELPRTVDLKMYRSPSDIEAESIKLIKSVLAK